jgi:lysophospholipase L1-like esterase
MVRTVNIGCVGDSLTEGGYPRILQELLKAREPSCQWNLHNLGILGSDTKEWVNDNLPAKRHHPPGITPGEIDLYLVMLGTNDAQVAKKKFFTQQKFSEQLSRIGKLLLEEGAAVIFVTPPPVESGGSFAQYIDLGVMNSVIPRIVPQAAAAIGAGWADAFSALGGAKPKKEALLDGVHLTKEGNKLIAQAVVNKVHQTVMAKPTRKPSICDNRASTTALPGPILPLAALAAPATVAVTKTQPPLLGLSPSAYSSLSPTTKVSATPRLQQTSADDYHQGAAVEIFSLTWDTWFVGRCMEVSVANILVEFVTPDGVTKEKRMPTGHPEMRLPGKPTLQATPVCQSSPVHGVTKSPSLCSIPVSGNSESNRRPNTVISSIVSSPVSKVNTSTLLATGVSSLNGASIGPANGGNRQRQSTVHGVPTTNPLVSTKCRNSVTTLGQSAFLPPAAVHGVYKRHRGYSDVMIGVR